MSDSDDEVLKQIESDAPPTEMKAAPKKKDGRAKPRSKAQIEATKRLVESTRARRAKSAAEKEKVLRAKYAPVKRREVKSDSESSGSDESSSSDDTPPPPRKPSRRQKKAAQPRRRGRAEPVVHNNYYYGWSGQQQPASAPPAPTPVKAKPERKMLAEEPPKPKPVKPAVKPQPSLRFV